MRRVPKLARRAGLRTLSGAFRHLATALRRQPFENGFAAIPEPGRGLVLSCPAYMPGGNASCAAAADPRGNGVAAGSFAP